MLVIDFPENYKDLFTPSKTESRNKSADVYSKFHVWVLRKIYSTDHDNLVDVLYDDINMLLPPGKTLNVSAVGVCEDEAKKLKDLYIEWARKAHKVTKAYAEKAHAWAHLDIGPRDYRKEDYTDSIKPGSIYVDMDRVWEDKRE